MRMTKSKNLLIKQGAVYGVKNRLRMTDVGVQLNAEMNLKAIRRKRRIDMSNTSNFSPSARVAIKEFEAWQMKVFKKNAKKGWRFFNPDAFDRPTPRSAREAWGAPYQSEDQLEKDEKITNRIMLGLFFAFVIVLSIL
jgi:hypothetical protein